MPQRRNAEGALRLQRQAKKGPFFGSLSYFRDLGVKPKFRCFDLKVHFCGGLGFKILLLKKAFSVRLYYI